MTIVVIYVAIVVFLAPAVKNTKIVIKNKLDKMCKKWQYLAQNAQKCRFWTKFGRFWAKNPNFYGSK